jgi:hypothetical protein
VEHGVETDGPRGEPDGEPDGGRQHARHRTSGRRRIWLFAGVVVAVVAVVVIVSVAREATRDVPRFPSLVANPDPALSGTVAYVDPATSCVRVIALSGGSSREVLCPPPIDPAEAGRLGKPVGPQLVWRADGRLEVTMFRMTGKPEAGRPVFAAGWQNVVDVRSGAVTDTPAAQVPAAPDVTTRPTVSPSGERVSFTSNGQTGHVTVKVTDASGRSRTLLDARGPGKFGYFLKSAFWAPDFRTVLADDGRILVITTDEPPVVRELVGQSSNTGFGGDPAYATFAATTANLLTPSG